MIPAWLVEKLREAEEAQAREDQASWDRQVSVEQGYGMTRDIPAPAEEPLVEGFAIIDFTI